MNQMDDLMQMAREADFCVNEDGGISTSNSYGIIQGELERFAQLVAKKAVEAEREACAKVCDARYMGDNNREDMETKRCAAAIRARSNT